MNVSFVPYSCAALHVEMTPASCQRYELWLRVCDGSSALCCDAGLWCVCRLGMTKWLFIISADRSYSPAGLPGSLSKFLPLSLCHCHPLSSHGSVAMIMNTNLSSDCVQLCLSVLLKIAEALCQSSKGTLFPVSLSKNSFVLLQFKEWPAFCPRSCVVIHVVLSHYETILWMFIIFRLYLHSYNNGSNFRQSLVADICFYMRWPKGLVSRIEAHIPVPLLPLSVVWLNPRPAQQSESSNHSLCWN